MVEHTSSKPQGVSLFRRAGHRLLELLGFAMVVAGAFRLWFEGWQVGAPIVAAGLVIYLVGGVDRFEFIKGWGIEARTRLEETLDRAEVTLERFRRLAELAGKTIIEFNSSVSGTSGTQPSMKDEYKKSRDVVELLRALRAPEDRIKELLLPWASVSGSILLVYVQRQLVQPAEEIRQAVYREIDELRRAGLSDHARIAALEQEHTRLQDYSSELFYDADRLAVMNPMEVAQRLRRLHWLAGRAKGMHAANPIIELWLPRIDHLVLQSDFRDQDEWFKVTRY